jgi:CBS domain-containing protein
MLVEDLITRSPVTLPPGALVSEAASLMKERNVGSVIVVDDGDVVGILTDRDIALALAGDEEDEELGVTAVRELMTRNPACLQVGTDVEKALEVMQRNAVRRIPLKNQRGDLLGLVSLDDIVMHLSQQLANASAVLRSEVVGRLVS